MALEPDRETPDATGAPLRDAIERVLAEPFFGERAPALAEELRAQPPLDDAVPLLESRARS